MASPFHDYTACNHISARRSRGFIQEGPLRRCRSHRTGILSDRANPNRSHLLLTDAIINLALGVLLVGFPKAVVDAVGMPPIESGFYASILGAVLFGIGIALFIEWKRGDGGLVGLGLAGAIAINLCGGLCLVGWLIFGSLGISGGARIVLWVLAITLFAISTAEWLSHRQPETQINKDT